MAADRSRRPRSCPAPTRRAIAAGRRSPSNREAGSTPSGSITASSRTTRRWPPRTTTTRAPASRTAWRWRRSRSCSSRRSTARLAPRALTGGVCYCCKTAVVATGDAIYAAWRHVYPGNLRDMAFTMSRDGGRTFSAPLRVSEDQWALEGCPDDGPAMAVDRQNRIHIVWPTLVGRRRRRRTEHRALLRDVRRRQAVHRARADPDRRHAASSAHRDRRRCRADDRVGRAGQRVAADRHRPRAIDGSGRPRIRREALADGGAGVYPAIAAAGDSTVAVWASNTSTSSSIKVRRIAASRTVATGQ